MKAKLVNESLKEFKIKGNISTLPPVRIVYSYSKQYDEIVFDYKIDKIPWQSGNAYPIEENWNTVEFSRIHMDTLYKMLLQFLESNDKKILDSMKNYYDNIDDEFFGGEMYNGWQYDEDISYKNNVLYVVLYIIAKSAAFIDFKKKYSKLLKVNESQTENKDEIFITYIDDKRNPGGSDKDIMDNYGLEVINRDRDGFDVVGRKEDIEAFADDYRIILDDILVK